MSAYFNADTLSTSAMLVIAMFVAMRILYGSWPWESNKTWYKTREQLRPRTPLPPPPTMLPTANTNEDHFDRPTEKEPE